LKGGKIVAMLATLGWRSGKSTSMHDRTDATTVHDQLPRRVDKGGLQG